MAKKYQTQNWRVAKENLDCQTAIVEYDGMQGYPCKGPNKKDKVTFIAPFSVSLTVRENPNEDLKRYYWCGIPKDQPKSSFAFICWLTQILKRDTFQRLLGRRKTILVTEPNFKNFVGGDFFSLRTILKPKFFSYLPQFFIFESGIP